MKKLLSLGLILFFSISAHANWTLNNEKSSVNFISVKKSSIGEVHHFTSLTGELSKGKANVKIDLSSVDTKIAIRDERLKTMLFEVAQFPKLSIETAVDDAKVNSLKAGESYQSQIMLDVNLHGITKKMPTYIQVIKLTDNNVLVSSVYPIIVKASDFELAKGIEALRAVANLPVISTAVPVSFNLVFTK